MNDLIGDVKEFTPEIDLINENTNTIDLSSSSSSSKQSMIGGDILDLF